MCATITYNGFQETQKYCLLSFLKIFLNKCKIKNIEHIGHLIFQIINCSYGTWWHRKLESVPKIYNDKSTLHKLWPDLQPYNMLSILLYLLSIQSVYSICLKLYIGRVRETLVGILIRHEIIQKAFFLGDYDYWYFFKLWTE